MVDASIVTRSMVLQKWGHLTDRQIGLFARDTSGAISGLVRSGVTEAQLLEFFDDVASMSWPESFGESPWQFALSVAFAFRLEAEPEPSNYYGLKHLADFRIALGR